MCNRHIGGEMPLSMYIFGQNKKNLRDFWLEIVGKNMGPVISLLMILISAFFARRRRKKYKIFDVIRRFCKYV